MKIFLPIVLTLILISACKSGEEPDEEDKLIGIWNMEQINVEKHSDTAGIKFNVSQLREKSVRIILREDYTFYLENANTSADTVHVASGSWVLDEESLSIIVFTPVQDSFQVNFTYQDGKKKNTTLDFQAQTSHLNISGTASKASSFEQ